MFEAMGYTLLPNHILVLEGPICPDQVTNVSRDAMTAYVECQASYFLYDKMQLIKTHIFISISDNEANISSFDCDATSNDVARNFRVS